MPRGPQWRAAGSRLRSFPPDNPFGLLAFLHWDDPWNNHHFPPGLQKKAIRQIKDLGVSFVRVDVLWSEVYRGPDQYNFARPDRLLRLLEESGLRALVLLQYNKTKEGPDGALWNKPPDSFEEFARYVAVTVSRYKKSVRHWEIWNEPNHPYYWVEPKNGLRRYSELLKLANRAAKSSDPACQVLNGGLTEPILEDVENLYRNGGKGSFDILNIHSFIDPLAADREDRIRRLLQGVRGIMGKNGDLDKKVWITEMGCPGVPAGVPPAKWFGGESVNEAEQADFLAFQYSLLEQYPWLGKIFWAFYRDTNDIFKEATDYFGLVRFDLSPKPAYERLKKIIGSQAGQPRKRTRTP